MEERITKKELQKIYSVSRFTIEDWVKNHNLPMIKISEYKRYVRKSDLYFGTINGSEINWTRVNDDSDMSFFHGTAAGDLNGDGLIDVGGTGSSGLKVFIQNQDGSFTNRTDILDWTDSSQNQIGGNPFAWDFEDLTGDGIAEIIMADYGGTDATSFNNISVWKYNNQSNKFELFFTETIPLSIHPFKRGATNIKVEDINNDGFMDIIVNSEGLQSYITLESWIGDGTGNFQLSWFYPWTTDEMETNEFFMMDANNDGYVDIIPVAAGGTRGNIVYHYPMVEREFNFQILINDRNGGFSPYSNKTLRDKFSSMSFALPYMKDGRIHFFGTAAANTGDRVNDQNQTMFFLTEDISFDITN